VNVQNLVRQAVFELTRFLVLARKFVSLTHLTLSIVIKITIWLALKGSLMLYFLHDIIAAFGIVLLFEVYDKFIWEAIYRTLMTISLVIDIGKMMTFIHI